MAQLSFTFVDKQKLTLSYSEKSGFPVFERTCFLCLLDYCLYLCKPFILKSYSCCSKVVFNKNS